METLQPAACDNIAGERVAAASNVTSSSLRVIALRRGAPFVASHVLGLNQVHSAKEDVGWYRILTVDPAFNLTPRYAQLIGQRANASGGADSAKEGVDTDVL